MDIEGIARWYQKKIGTYDKQLWETSVEQKILHDLTHVRTKVAKPKTEFIDLDLIRGSSFPKAKPKLGLFVVTLLSIQRLLFYPLYGKWWIRQTSSTIFKIFFILYFLQLVKIHLYFLHWKDAPSKETNHSPSLECDIIIPILIMLIMSFIHSVIVSTNTDPAKINKGRKTKHKRKSYLLRSFTRRNKITRPAQRSKRTFDEGFESFNGNGSSEYGEERKNKTTVKNDLSVEKKEPTSIDAKKVISDVGESDTESEQEMVVRKRLLKIKTKEESDTDSDTQLTFKSVSSMPASRRGSRIKKSDESSYLESDENEITKVEVPPKIKNKQSPISEWIGVTTNSEDCSYSSQSIDSDSELNNNDQTVWDNDLGPATILNPSCAPSDLVSCTIWEHNDMRKAELSVLDISSSIIGRVEYMRDSLDYFYFGIFFSMVLCMIPIICRIVEHSDTLVQGEDLSVVDISFRVVEHISTSFRVLLNIAFGTVTWQRFIMMVAVVERFFLAMLFFFQLAVAERTFKQRFLYAKLFCHLTSSRKARKSDLPHFRLNKVRNIKTWLSVRSYLKKRGPQRSVDVIVSTSFIITLLLLSFVSIELVKNSCDLCTQYSIETLFWCLFLGLYLLRFMTLGTKIHNKYRNLSVLITEQINLYLQIELKPNKKEELMVANCVLKLASDLLKELESPFKISGLSANPYLYTITKLVILSALSGVFSEMLGFKLKLHKLKIK